MLLRFARERHDPLRSEETARSATMKERVSTIAIGVMLILLAIVAWVLASYQLYKQEGPDTATPGLIVSAASLSFMFFLWYWKTKTAVALNSSTMHADAKCSLGCIWLSVVLLVNKIK